MGTRLLLAVMFAVAVITFGAPFLYSDQADTTVSVEALRRLKTQAVVPYDGLHPRTIQAIEAHMIGPTPDHVVGTVVFRSLFGVPVGKVTLGAQDQTLQFDGGAWLGVWLGFLMLEGMLGIYALWRAVRE